MSDALNRESTDAMHWAEQYFMTVKQHNITSDPEYLMGWFANYWAAVHDPLHNKIEQQAKRIEELEEENSDLKSLLRRVGDCPTCDGSGAYYTSTGAEAQCQFCYERDELIPPTEDKT